MPLLTLSCLSVWRGDTKALADPGAGANEGATEGGGEQAANGNAAVGALWNWKSRKKIKVSYLEISKFWKASFTRPKRRNQHRLGVLRPQHRPQFTAQRVTQGAGDGAQGS